MLKSILQQPQAREARAIAQEIAARLVAPKRYEQHVAALPPITRSVVDLAYGYSGAALLFSALAKSSPADTWDFAAHEYLALAFASGVEAPSGLFVGYAGLLFAMNARSRSDPRYLPYARQLASRIPKPGKLECPATRTAGDYDLISGIAGSVIAVAPHSRSFRDESVDVFDRLSRSDECTPWLVVNPSDALDAYIDYGVAHGITGVLGALCIVTDFQEHRELKRRLVDTIVAARIPNKRSGAYCWPSKVGALPRLLPKPGWCYGVPGVASVLIIASRHLEDVALERLALDAFEDVATCSVKELGLLDSSLCHGTAGTAALAAAIAQLTRSAPLIDCGRRLGQTLIDAYDPAAPLGYRQVIDGQHLDNPALLGGATGIALALLFLAGDIDGNWLQAFGLCTTPCEPLAIADDGAWMA